MNKKDRKVRDKKTRILAWLLCVGLTLSSMPESFLYGAAFTDGSELDHMTMEEMNTGNSDGQDESAFSDGAFQGEGMKEETGTVGLQNRTQYQVSGSILWEDDHNSGSLRPEIEDYFTEQFKIWRNGNELYSEAEIIYAVDGENTDCWKFQVEGLWSADESGTAQTYVLVPEKQERYLMENDVRLDNIARNVNDLLITYKKEELTPTPEVAEEPTVAPEVTEEPAVTPEVSEEPTIIPEVTEEPTTAPEVTPEPTVVPEKTPDAIPEITEEPAQTPEAAPEVTEEPAVTPEVSEEPTIIPEVTEEPTAAPEVTPEPTPDLDAEDTEDTIVSDEENDDDTTEDTIETVSFRVSKRWLDNTDTTRPVTILKLYRTTNSSTEGTPVTDEKGNPVQWTLKTSKVNKRFNDDNASETIVTESSEAFAGATLPDYGAISLPKYDDQGAEYNYFVEETMSGGTAEYFKSYLGEWDKEAQVFTEENDNFALDGTSYAADGGTLSNRIEKQIDHVAEEVTWIADHYKNEIEDVTVIMTLQCRRTDRDEIGAPVYDWKDVVINNSIYTKELTGFKSGNMTQTVQSDSMPQYDSEGKTLEYRWIESGIKQNDTLCELKSDKDVDGDGSLDTYFQLSQNTDAGINGEEYFKSYIIPEGQPYAGTVINRLVGSASDHIEKQWDAEIEEEKRGDSVTVRLDQKDFLGRTVNSWKDILITKKQNWELTITNIPDGEGGFTKKPLPKYDSNGAAYHYEAVEEENETWIASYTNTESGTVIFNKKRENQSEISKVIESNGSASANLIWRDISEKKHTIENLPVELRYKVGDGRWGGCFLCI